MEKWQYGVVIDAGSSGSRVHVYRWLDAALARMTEDREKYESLPVLKTKKSWTKKIHPGVSKFGWQPDQVGPDHLQELLDHALDIVPSEQVSTTPIFLLATAGMRLLPDLERHTLLSEICSYTRTNSKFLLPDCDLHIQVIPGSTEGLYGWVAANYLLGGFDSPDAHDHGKDHHTYGFLDMGGASAQIAFAPNSTEADKHANDLTLVRLRKVNGAVDEYRVFVSTWLGFGVNQARERYVEALTESAHLLDGELPDPCLPKGLPLNTKGDILTGDKVNGKETHFIGTGQFEECLRQSWPLLGKDKPCKDEPCLLDGVHVPAIDFDVNHFVGVSEYWHTTHGIFEMGHKDRPYDFATYQKLVTDFCSAKWVDIKKELDEEKWDSDIDEKDAAEVCFKANWIINMLHSGIGIPKGTTDHSINGTKEVLDSAKQRGFLDPFQAVNKIDDVEVSWTLGKMLLYAASEVPPGKTNNRPVGFGSNVEGIPMDWQYPGIPVDHFSPRPNSTWEEPELDSGGWREALFEGKTPRRVPGFLLFLAIIGIATFLLCGKDRRARCFRRFRGCFGPGGRANRRRGGHMAPKIALNGQAERLLEGGMVDPEDFELGPVDDDSYSDDSTGNKAGRSSGWDTPRMRTPKSDSFSEGSVSHGTHGSGGSFASLNGLGINAMDRSGLIPRTDSRERIHGVDDRGRRSRRASPTRLRTPVMSSVVED